MSPAAQNLVLPSIKIWLPTPSTWINGIQISICILNRPLQASYVDGQEWTHFPLRPDGAGTDYLAIPDESLLVFAREKYRVDKDPVKFHTPYLHRSYNSYWALTMIRQPKVESGCTDF